jgi:methionyl-tRNA formyltransferase
MKILILTSHDHLYANFILGSLIRKGLFDADTLIVFEQDSIIPKKSKTQGLLKYLQTSGVYYVVMQIVKLFIFSLVQKYSLIRNNKLSPYYPYYKLLPLYDRKILNNINSDTSFNEINNIKPDLILSVYSKEIISTRIIQLPNVGVVNVHPALLPAYKGVSPTFWCLANNEKYSGATLHYIDEGIDTGKVISQSRFKLENTKSEHQLYMRCSSEGVKLIISFLNSIKNGQPVVTKTIINKTGSYYSLPTKNAVGKFISNGYKFFTLQEMLV